MQILKLYLDDAAADALKIDAKNNRRNPHQQGEVIINQHLIENGLLSPTTPATSTTQPQHAQAVQS